MQRMRKDDCMSKRDCNWDYKKLQRYVSEGYGSGVLSQYKPWLSIQSFPSKGRVSRIRGWKTGRIHHLFSDIQSQYFYLIDWNENVTDIREHFPLLDLADVLPDNKDLNQKYFDRENGAYVLTTTFMITLKNNTHIARSIKLASDLNKKSVLQRLEIERRYWAKKGIDWGVVTPKEMDIIAAKNIEWVHPTLYSFEERGLTLDKLHYYSENFINIIRSSNEPIRKITSNFDSEYDLDAGTGLFIFKYLIAIKGMEVDMSKPIEIGNRTAEMIVRINGGGELIACNQ